MQSERSSVYEVMRSEIDARFPETYNDNSDDRRKTGNGLRKGLVALSISVGIFGNISGCNSYLADKIAPRQETVYESKNGNLPSKNIPVYFDELFNGIAATCFTYYAGRAFLSKKLK